MAKQYKVLVNTAKAEDNLVLDVPQSKGDKGGPLRIKAKAGQKYQLQEITNATDKPVAPDYVKTRRVGKNLHILFEGDKEASVIIEDYYDVAAEGSNGLIGQAENGSFYEYIPEDPNSDGLVPNLRDGGEAVNVALGGDEVQAAGAAVGLLVFNPLLAALGAGAAAAAAAAGGTTAAAVTPTPTPTPTATPTGALAGASDTGAAGDNRTKDTTPELTGKATAGSTVVIDLKDATGKVIGTYSTTADVNGNYSIKVPQNLADGTYTPTIKVTPTGGTTTTTDGTPFTIDTVAPTIAVTADKTSLVANDKTTVTFTLSEAVADFNDTDVQVTGGTLSGFVQSATDPKVYTAVFTPTPNSTTPSVITVANGRFSDTASNFNTDGAEVNNSVSLPTNTNTNGATGAIAPTSDTGTTGDNKTSDNTPTYSGKAPANATVVVEINGKSYPTKADANGNYSIVVPDTDKLPDGTYTPKIIVTPEGSASSSTSEATPFTIDTTAPTIAIVADKATLSTGQTSILTFTLSEVSTDFTAADVNVTGGTLSGFAQSATDPKVYTAVFTPTANVKGSAVISVASSKFSDAAANQNKDGAEPDNTVTLTADTTGTDTTPPTIAITSDKANLTAGQAAVITFTLSEASADFTAADVAVSGGTLSNFVQDSTDPKVFKAVFTPNANSTTNSVISVASDKFSDASSNINKDGADANNTVTLPTNTTTSTATGALTPTSDTGTSGDNKTLDNTPDIQGTTTPGAAVSVLINGKTYTATADASGKYAFNVPDILPDGTYTPEITVTPTGGTPSKSNGTPFTIDTTTNVAISKTGTANSKDPISGTAEAGDVVVVKDANGNVIGSATADARGNWSLTPTNAVPAGAITATATDAAGNVANAKGANGTAPTPSVKTALSIDPITPDNIVSTTEGAASTYTVTGKVTGVFASGDVVTLVLNTKNYTAAVAADGSFKTDVSMVDIKADVGTKITGSVTGTGGDTATAGQDYALETANNAGTQTALSIDPVTADNNIGSSEATGNIAITGKVTGKFSVGDTVTLTVNGKSFTGTAAANGSYSISVPAAELTGDSDTKLEGAVTGTGGTAATAFQDYATNANINPTPTPVPSVKTALSIDPITPDNIINTTEGAATSYTVTGKVTGTFAAGDTVSLTLNGKVLTAVAAADGSFSAVVSMTDLKADAATKITGTVKGTGGDTATAGQDYVVETSGNAGTQTVLSINPVTADNNISSSEATGDIAITGQVTGKFSAGDTVTLTVNGKTFTGPAAADGSFRIAVPASDLGADSDTQIDGTISGTGGTTATAFQDYATNANINPTPPSNTTVGLAVSISTDANNDALVNIAELGASNNFTSHVTVNSKALVGDKVVITASNGSTALSSITHTLTANDIANGFDVTFAKPAEGVIQTVTANYMDASGNAATDAAPTDNAKLDTTAPKNADVSLALSITTDNSPNDGVVNSPELGSATSFTSRATFNAKAVAGDKIVFTATNGTTALSTQTLTLTAADITAGFKDVTFAKPAEGVIQTVTANYMDASGNAATDAAPTDNAKLDTTAPNANTAPTVVITTDTNNDGTVNFTELNGSATFEVKGSFDSTKVAVGDKLVFSNGSTSNTVVLTQAMVDAGFATTTFAKPAEGGTLTVTAKLQDTSGNATPDSASDAAKLDTTAPNGGTAPTVEISTDANNDGTVSSAELGTASTFAIKASFDKTKVVAGDKVIFSDGTTSTTVVLSSTDITNGFATTTFAKPAEGGSMTVMARLQDSVGNNSAGASDTAKLDTSAPNAGNALTLTIDTDVNNDGFVNFTEIGNTAGTPKTTLTVSAAFDKTKVSVGDIVTITNTATGGEVKVVTLDAAMVEAGKVTTTFTSPGDGNNFTVKASIKDAVGNVVPDATDTAKLDLSNLNPDPNNNPGNKLAVKIEISTDANNDGVLNIAEMNGGTTANILVSLPTDAKAGDTLVITGTGNNTQSITLSTAQVTAGSVTTSFTSPANGAKLDVTAVISDSAGNVSNTALDSATVNTTPVGAPTITITTDANNDAVINKTELNGATNVSVKTDLPSTAVAGDTITVTDGTTVKTHVLTAADITAKSVSDTFTAPAEGQNISVSATLKAAASGNVSPSVSDSASFDTLAPNDGVAPTVVITTDADNSGVVNKAELGSSTTFAVQASFDKTKVVVGDKMIFTDGITTTTVVLNSTDIANGFATTTFVKPAEGGSMTVTAKLQDSVGNDSASASDTAKLDTTAPNNGKALTLTIDTDANNDAFVNFAEIGNTAGTPNTTLTVSAAFDKTQVAVGDIVTITDTATGGATKTITLDAAMVAAGKVTTTFASPGDGKTFTVKANITDTSGNTVPDATDSAVLDLSNLNPDPNPNNNPSKKLAAVIEITTDGNNDQVLNAAEIGTSKTANIKVSLPTDAAVGDTLVITGTGNTTQTLILDATQIAAKKVELSFNLPANGSKLD
ncbi:MAG: hypothetical protein CFE39_15070, partial [Comamonadaceae bacterium PBBC2]